MGPFEAQIFSVAFGVGGAVVALGMILRFSLRKRELEARGGESHLEPVVDSLREDLNETRAQLTEVQERLDFAERLLTEGRASGGREPAD